VVTPRLYGCLVFFDPSIPAEDLARNQKATPAYNPEHVYELVVVGEGKTLKAVVPDTGGYADNAGGFEISVFRAVATDREPD
jgi:hypothetical protein